MDCDTTGIEPDFALVKFKKLAGGGYFKIINRMVPDALRTLGYGEADIAEIVRYAVGHGTLVGAPGVNHQKLVAKGFDEDALARVEAALESAFDIKFVFNKWTLGQAFSTDTLGLSAAELDDPGFDMLASLGFSKEEIEAANTYCRCHDARGSTTPLARAPARVRLRQPLRPARQALPLRPRDAYMQHRRSQLHLSNVDQTADAQMEMRKSYDDWKTPTPAKQGS